MKKVTLVVLTVLSFLSALTAQSCNSQKVQLKARIIEFNGDLLPTYLFDSKLVPRVSPYQSLAVLETSFVLDTTNIALSGENKLVDWVLVSLIDSTNTIKQTRSALVQSDGDIVGLDGISPLQFTVQGKFQVSIRYRNALGIKTLCYYNFGNYPDIRLDFTNNSVSLFGDYNQLSKFGYSHLINGDINRDGEIDSYDFSVLMQNFGAVNVYSNSDLNLDGAVNIADKMILMQNNGLYQEW